MDENTSPGLVGWFKAHSTIIFIVIVGLVAGVAFLKRNPTSSTTPAASSVDTTGLQTDANGVPIIYRDVADTFINVSVNPNSTQPVASAPPTTAGGEHPIEPTPSSSTTTSSSSSTSTGNTATSINGTGISVGLLGPNAAVNFTARTFTSPMVKTPTPLPIPSNDRLVQGSQNRVWYIDNGIQRLLTSGVGPPVNNDGLPVGSAGNTPH